MKENNNKKILVNINDVFSLSFILLNKNNKNDENIDTTESEGYSGYRGAKGSIRDRLISIIFRKRYEKFKLQKEFYTKDKLTEYEIISVFRTTANSEFKYYEFVNANNEKEFETFVTKCKHFFYKKGNFFRKKNFIYM